MCDNFPFSKVTTALADVITSTGGKIDKDFHEIIFNNADDTKIFVQALVDYLKKDTPATSDTVEKQNPVLVNTPKTDTATNPSAETIIIEDVDINDDDDDELIDEADELSVKSMPRKDAKFEGLGNLVTVISNIAAKKSVAVEATDSPMTIEEPLIDTYELHTLKKKAEQLKESIAYDEQELESLKYERDRIIENIARTEARFRESRQHLESLKMTVTIDTTATSEEGMTTFSVNENIDTPIYNSVIDTTDTSTATITTVAPSIKLANSIAYWQQEVKDLEIHLKLENESLIRKEAEIAQVEATLKQKQRKLDGYLAKLAALIDNRKTA